MSVPESVIVMIHIRSIAAYVLVRQENKVHWSMVSDGYHTILYQIMDAVI